jgi:hypothetical protein
VDPGRRRDDPKGKLAMATLRVTNGFTKPLPGLGRNTPFSMLSQKRVSRCVREEGLRPNYGDHNVTVTCEPAFDGKCWQGTCEINGKPERFSVYP